MKLAILLKRIKLYLHNRSTTGSFLTTSLGIYGHFPSSFSTLCSFHPYSFKRLVTQQGSTTCKIVRRIENNYIIWYHEPTHTLARSHDLMFHHTNYSQRKRLFLAEH